MSADLGPDFELDLVPWQIPHVRLRFSAPSTGVATGAWRAPAHVANACAVETLLDEVAQLTGRAPWTCDSSSTAPRARSRSRAKTRRPTAPTAWPQCCAWPPIAAASASVRRKAACGGLAAHYTFGSYCAQVAELSVDAASAPATGGSAPRRVTVHTVTCALDCGIVVNRSGVEAQAQGGIIDGLGTACFGAVSIDRGRAVEGNFDRYRLIRHREAPRAIDVHIVPSTMRPTGFGEIAVPVIAPAIANAIASATGQRLRRTPLVREGYTLG